MIHGPAKVRTEDGCVFERQPNGSYTDGDLVYRSLSHLRECVDWVPVFVTADFAELEARVLAQLYEKARKEDD